VGMSDGIAEAAGILDRHRGATDRILVLLDA
jgi:hypothetical protein